jgi:hypothetical protein
VRRVGTFALLGIIPELEIIVAFFVAAELKVVAQ